MEYVKRESIVIAWVKKKKFSPIVMREFKSLYYKRWVTFTMKCYNALLNVYSY